MRILVTHDNCADGLASAMVALDANPELRVLFAQYNTPSLDDLEAAEGMVFCDIAPPRARVAEFVAAGARVLDHHKHARDIVQAFGGNGRFADEDTEPGVSGATLAYRHLWRPRPGANIDAVSRFVYLVATRDTWQKQRPEWDEAQDLHTTLMGLPREYWLRPGGIERVMSDDARELGRMFRRQREEKTRAICAHGILPIVVDGRRWAAFPAQAALMSDTAEALRGDGYGVSVGWFQTIKDGFVATVCSMRSDGSLDVGELCKRLGGGGHSRAAGCTIATGNAYEAIDRIKAIAGELYRQGQP